MEAGRQSVGVLQSFRKEIMVTWTRVMAVEMERNGSFQETYRELSLLD